MKLHEYQSKRLFALHGVPIPAGDVADGDLAGKDHPFETGSFGPQNTFPGIYRGLGGGMKREVRDDIPDHPCKAYVLDDDRIRPDGVEIGNVSGCTCEFVVMYKSVYRDVDPYPVHMC